MSRVFIDGFEHNSLSSLWEVVNGATIVSSPVITGNYSARIHQVQYLEKCLESSYSELFFAFKFNFYEIGGDPLIYFSDSDHNINLGIRRYNGVLRVHRGNYGDTVLANGTKYINYNQTYLIEIYVKPLNSGGVIEIKIDGTQEVYYTGDTTKYNENVKYFRFGNGSQYAYYYLDDVIVDDSGWIGNTRIKALTISGAGNSSQWTPLSGSNYENVDELPHSDTDYNYTNSIGNIDTYALNNINWNVYSIKSIQVQCRASYEGNPTPTHIQLVTRVNGTDYFSSDLSTGLSFSNVINVWDLNPDDSQIWEEADINALEIGIKATA